MPAGHYLKIAEIKRKYADEKVIQVKRLLGQGLSHRSIANEVGVGRSFVADISCGRRHKEIV
jgi:transposase